MIRILELPEVEKYINDDPVRPHLTADFRTSCNGEVYGLFEDTYAAAHEPMLDPLAIICVAYTNEVPESEESLKFLTQAASQDGQRGTVAVFYTVWSYDKGAGRKIVLDVSNYIKETKPWIKQWVTLSPLTKMAERFHIRNGAVLLDKYDTCQNFDYTESIIKESEYV